MACLRDQTDQRGYDILMESLRGQLGDDDIAAFAEQGARLTEDAVIDETLAMRDPANVHTR